MDQSIRNIEARERILDSRTRGNHAWSLWPGERLLRIGLVRSSTRIHGMRLITTHRESPWFGEYYDGTMEWIDAPDGFCINGIHGIRAPEKVIMVGVRIESIDYLAAANPHSQTRSEILAKNALTCPCIPQSGAIEDEKPRVWSASEQVALAHTQIRAVTFQPGWSVDIMTPGEYARMITASRDRAMANLRGELIYVLTEDEVVTGVQIATCQVKDADVESAEALRLETTRGLSPWLGDFDAKRHTVATFRSDKGRLCGFRGRRVCNYYQWSLTELEPLFHTKSPNETAVKVEK